MVKSDIQSNQDLNGHILYFTVQIIRGLSVECINVRNSKIGKCKFSLQLRSQASNYNKFATIYF